MSLKSDACDRRQLENFVAHRLSEPDQSVLEQHLATCAQCRRELDQMVATDQHWQKASLYLRDEDGDLRSLSHLSSSADGLKFAALRSDRVTELLAPSDDPQYLGRLGEYEISGVVGCGGMGAVLKGFDRALNRVVAIKVMAPHLASSGAARQRFAREAQAAAAITHDNVIDIYGVAEANGLPYLVMPYSRGTSLQKRIDKEGRLPVIEVLRIGHQIAAGLAAAHGQGLVHRDIKPANILTGDGVDRLQITDFGLARAVDDASVTRTGVIAGTPHYMSPEQARGDAVDHRSDLFSLGSVLYTCCTGHPPFRAESAYGILRRITDNEPRPIRETNPDIPDWLCAIIERLHEKSADARFQSASAVADLFKQCITYWQTPNSPLPDELRVRRKPSRRWRYIVGGIAVLLMTAGFVTYGPGWLKRFARSNAVEREVADEPGDESISAGVAVSGAADFDSTAMTDEERWIDPRAPSPEVVLLQAQSLAEEAQHLGASRDSVEATGPRDRSFAEQNVDAEVSFIRSQP